MFEIIKVIYTQINMQYNTKNWHTLQSEKIFFYTLDTLLLLTI